MDCDDEAMFFFFNDTATTEIYTLSLHDALPIFDADPHRRAGGGCALGHLGDLLWAADVAGVQPDAVRAGVDRLQDRKSTRLNSSHANISYAVFCLKKKKRNILCSLLILDPSPSR